MQINHFLLLKNIKNIESAKLCMMEATPGVARQPQVFQVYDRSESQSWALSVFEIFFSIIENDCLAFFIKLIAYFCTSPIKKANSQSN